jgi:hypothetical protein
MLMLFSLVIGSITLLLYAAFPTFQLDLTGYVYIFSVCLFFGLLIIFTTLFSSKFSNLRLVAAIYAVTSAVVVIVSDVVSEGDPRSYAIDESTGLPIIIWSESVTLFFLPCFLLLAIWVMRDLNTARDLAVTSEQRDQIKLMRVGFILAIYFNFIIAGVLGSIALEFSVVLAQWLIQIIATIVSNFGTLIIFYAYIRDDKALFYQPFSLDALIVISEVGLPVFDYSFSKDTESDKFSLASGAITAIGAIMKEAFGASSDIKAVQLKDKVMMLHVEHKHAFVLVTDSSNTYLTEALQLFARNFIDTYREKLDDPMHNVAFDAGHIVQQSFGFTS